MRRIVPALVSAALLVLAGGSAHAAAGPRLDGCQFVSTADAAALLGDRTARLPATGRDCIYVASPGVAGEPSPGLLVQARRWNGKLPVPQFATAVDVGGARRCWTVQLQGLTLACYQHRRLLTVTATDTADDTATATATMEIALGELR
jgi:hypothetical protein